MGDNINTTSVVVRAVHGIIFGLMGHCLRQVSSFSLYQQPLAITSLSKKILSRYVINKRWPHRKLEAILPEFEPWRNAETDQPSNAVWLQFSRPDLNSN